MVGIGTGKMNHRINKNRNTMKKIIIILSAVAIIAGGCGQTPNQQVKTENETTTAYQEDMPTQIKDTSSKLSENYEILSEPRDCEVPDRQIMLKSKGQKKDFSLILAFCDENIQTGYVRYEGQTERIPIQFDHEEIVDERTGEGRPNVRELFYNEI
jgi:hypothetical protein